MTNGLVRQGAHMRKPYIHSTQREGLPAWGNNNESVKNERHAHEDE
ncbi:MAG: hypothetical protein OJF50_001750 [Nitrospira sp.]|nr:hypothetical protein [Nitrospira sp.]